MRHRIIGRTICAVGLIHLSLAVAASAQQAQPEADPAPGFVRSVAPMVLDLSEVEQRELRPCSILQTDEQLRGVHDFSLWLDNTVPYAFNANVSPANQAAAINAMGLIEAVSSVDFVARTTESDYIVFNDAAFNNSFVGRIGGPQIINIFNWDAPYVIAHECMHALGIYHEQSRSDRGSYVQINTANICQDCCAGGPCDANFDIVGGAALVGDYDFDSVMHYSQCLFSVCSNCVSNPSSCRTITVLPPYDTQWQNAIGQADHFSDGDILTIQTMYPSLSLPCESFIGDLDNDDDADVADYAIFQRCFDDSTGGRAECSCADKNVDEFIDQQDTTAFIEALHGPDVTLGACCDESGICTEGTAAECAGPNQTYQGDGVACADTDCPITSPGACCDPDGLSCTETSRGLCEAAGSFFKGEGTTCDGAMCPAEYSNTSSSLTLYAPGAGVDLGDDMTLAGTARALVYYDLTVFGQAASPFDVDVQLYTACPGAGGTPIAGTAASFTNVSNNTPVVLSQTLNSITIPNTVYMVVEFSANNVAWVVGGQAETGSTVDNFGLNQPPWNCGFSFTGSTYAGFRANIICAD